MKNKVNKYIWTALLGIAALLIVVFCILWNVIRKNEPEVFARDEVSKARQAQESKASELSAMDIMCEPSGITAMEDGSLLVTDTYGKVVWKVKDGKSTVYAGGDTVEDPYGEPLGGYNDKDPKGSYFKEPWAIAPFLDGYAVSDSENNVVRLIRKNTVETINGTTTENLPVTEHGAAFVHPTGLAADEEGSLYIADTHQNAIRKITKEGSLTTFASALESPMGICWKNGALYVAETEANRIVKVENGNVSVVAGNGTDDLADGQAEQAAFSMPKGVAVADDGTIYVADTGNSAIRKIQNGEVTTVLARNIDDIESFTPISPTGLLIQDDQLYICDNFSRKVLIISLK